MHIHTLQQWQHIQEIPELEHISLEVQHCTSEPCLPRMPAA